MFSFNEAINFISSKLDSLPHNFQTIMCGDFNFPHIDWELGEVFSGMSPYATISASKLINFSNCHMLNQYVQYPTRENNILDLFFTSNPFMVINSAVESTSMSDHKLVEMVLVLNTVPFCPATESRDNSGFQG